MTSREDIVDRLRPIVAEHYGVDECTVEMDTNFIGDFGGGLFSLLELLVKVEEEFEVLIPEEKKTKADSFQRLISLIIKSLKNS